MNLYRVRKTVGHWAGAHTPDAHGRRMIHLYWRGTTLAGIRFVPTLIHDRCQPRIMTPAEAVGVFHRMWAGTDLLKRLYHTPGDY
ncbi:MAG TPA: hypothetical protein VIC85_16300 [Ktedonobacterales bacterium]